MNTGFFKVSDEQLKKDWEKLEWPMSGENSLEDALFKNPRRATASSAGYDMFAPINLLLKPGESMTIPTGFKFRVPSGYFLMIVPRSGLGFKFQIGLANTVGIIDADYFDNVDNEGHIFVKLVNYGDKECRIEKGKAFAQAIILKYFITDDDNVEEIMRLGGIGSTDVL